MPTERKNGVQWYTQGFNYYLELQEHGGNKRHTGFLFVCFIIVFFFFNSLQTINTLITWNWRRLHHHSFWYILESVQYILRVWDFLNFSDTKGKQNALKASVETEKCFYTTSRHKSMRNKGKIV